MRGLTALKLLIFFFVFRTEECKTFLEIELLVNLSSMETRMLLSAIELQ